ncbi:MAG: glycoside hydrolase family 28 protein [Bacteroidales bacterium]|nr:glycoside hydrolase family 28 protein [Bacteroidales bacterium]
MLTMVSCGGNTDQIAQAFVEAEKMVASMQVPTFKGDTISIVAEGAQEDGEASVNQKAILSAIDKVHENGGGVVLVPKGTWQTGPITLKSNVNLCIAEGATLRFSTNYEDYFPTVETRWEGVDCNNMHPLIYANGETNIAISGKGTIDGQASNDVWWYMKGKSKYGWKKGLMSQGDGGRDTLLAYDRDRVPVEQRGEFDLEDALRPQLINIRDCKCVLIEGVRLTNSPFWVIHPLLCEDLTVRGVKIESHGPNSDGCDPESCKNVLIEDCFFDTGDDCIAIKSGRNNDGRRWNRPSENIYVRDCQMKNGHGGVVIGSEISGGFKNLWVENCSMDSPELDRVIRIKTSDCRGGVIENVFVRNVVVGDCYEAVLKINLMYEPEENCEHNFPPTVRNINMQNITSTKSKYGVYIVGMNNAPERVDGVRVIDCSFNGVEKGNNVKNAINVDFNNLLINGRNAELE